MRIYTIFFFFFFFFDVHLNWLRELSFMSAYIRFDDDELSWHRATIDIMCDTAPNSNALPRHMYTYIYILIKYKQHSEKPATTAAFLVIYMVIKPIDEVL